MTSPAPPRLAPEPLEPGRPDGASPPAWPRCRRRWWLAPLVLLSVVVGGIGQTAAAGTVTAYEAVHRLRYGAVSVDDAHLTAALNARRARGVTAVLGRMNAALATRDLAGYLATFDGDAGLRRRQTAVFQGLGRMPFALVRYGWNPSRWTRPLGLSERYGDAAIMAVVTRQYQLKGWDRAPTGELVAFTFAPKDGRWTVVGDGTGEGYSLPDDSPVPGPWAFGDVSVLTTAHVLLVGDRATSRQKDLRRLAGRIEAVVGDVRSVWPSTTWNGRVVVYALTDRRFLTAWLGDQWSEGEQDDDTAVTYDAWVSSIDGMAPDGTATEYPVAGARMVVTPGMLGSSAEKTRAVVRHELTHVATAMRGKQAPSWLSEGAAEYTAYRVLRSSGRANGVEALHRRGLPRQLWSDLRKSSYRPDLVTDHAYFYGGTSDEVDRRYSDSWFAALYIADTYGEATLRAFYEKATDPAYAGPAAREEVALRTVLNTDRATFVKRVGEYARALRRNFQ